MGANEHHRNLMLDTFLCNASIEEQVSLSWTLCSNLMFYFDSLRAAVRGLLSSGSPGIASAFTTAARTQLQKTSNTSVLQSTMPIFAISSQTATWQPTKRLADMLMRARSLYGVGMAFSSLDILAAIVRAASELRWPSDGEMADTLAMIDADIAQALQARGIMAALRTMSLNAESLGKERPNESIVPQSIIKRTIVMIGCQNAEGLD
ncbi:aldo keto reductase [Salix suchowensis]|nr:aldo keto reductase [Salix suchowensis]